MSRETHEYSWWKILKAYFRENSIANTQIKSYDEFITFGIQQIVEQEVVKIGNQHKVIFGHVRFEQPQVIEEDRTVKGTYPSDARARDLTYDSAIYCDITEIYENEDGKETTKHHPLQVIGRMPVMLHSSICNLRKMSPDERLQVGECPEDRGGYFIIKGNERVLVGQMRANYNQIIVIRQTLSDKKYNYIAEVRSMSSETGHSVLVQALHSNDGKHINFSLPYIKEHIPVAIVFKALGYTSDTDIENLIALPMLIDEENLSVEKDRIRSVMDNILKEGKICETQKEALQYIGNRVMHTISDDKRETYAWQVVEAELFPHLGITGTLLENAYFLGAIVRKLLYTVFGLRSEDDRDNLANKRVDVAGALLYELFRNLFKKFVNNLKASLEKKKRDSDALPLILKNKSLTKSLHQCLATGNWSVQKNASYVKTGVSQILDRITFGASYSHLKRILLPVGKEGKNAAIRMIHPSQIGNICPAETPEGHKVGIVLNFALLADVTGKIPTINVRQILMKQKEIKSILDVKISEYAKLVPIFLNGIIIGFSKFPEKTLKMMRKLRYDGLLEKEVSISYDTIDREIRIFCDEGRFIRPVLSVTGKDLNISAMNEKEDEYDWLDLVSKGYIQYIDPAEAEWSVISMYPGVLKEQKSHFCEIHPCVILGMMASIIPWPDHSQSPRNCYQCSMGKQAIGIPVYSYNHRTDTLLRILHYSQRPIIFTKPSELLGFNRMVSGINNIVAITPWQGFNQEDSVCFNASAAERGAMVITSYRTLDEYEKKRDTYSHEKICIPPETTLNRKQDDPAYFRRKNANYSLLDNDGIIRSRVPYERKCGNVECSMLWYAGSLRKCPECKKIGLEKRGGNPICVKKGDVIIGKIVVSSNKNSQETRVDASKVIDEGEEGIVDRVHVYITPSGYKLVKVVIRRVSEPILGDKLASRSAQKGTIGQSFRETDLPFTEHGIFPEIMINPLCMPSRMTINQLIECAHAKVCAIEGTYGDATPFTDRSINIASKLVLEGEKGAYSRDGWELMRNGYTGEKIFHKIFIGPTFYQRLKHTVQEKIHARARGPSSTLTRQPLEGRARDGGLRFGEMERDCMISHGASEFLKERLFTVSDKFKVSVCEKCGIMTNTLTECQLCKGTKVVCVNLPYASKLMIQELTQLLFKIRIFPEKTKFHKT